MKTFYYPFWRKQYFFHEDSLRYKELISIYQPYKWLLKCVYFLWRNIIAIRYAFSIKIRDSYVEKNIISAIPDLRDSVWVIDIGRKSLHRKVSGIMIKEQNGSICKTFFKVGNTSYAKHAVEKEAGFYKKFSHLGIVPKLITFKSCNKLTYYTAEYIDAKKLTYILLDENITDLIIKISELPIDEMHNYSKSKNLKLCFSHGDMCPWNILRMNNSNSLLVVDWEFAGIYPLGFDFLTYIFQATFLLERHLSARFILQRNKLVIDNFYKKFGIIEINTYLNEFALICSERQRGTYLEKRFAELLNLIS